MGLIIMFNEKKSFGECVNEAKRKAYISSIISIFMIFIVLYISIKLNNYVLFVLELIMFIISINKIKKYSEVKKIKNYLIKNNLIDKIGNINFMNEGNYFLTEYYMIVLYKQNILCFDYSKIKKVYKEYWNKFDISATTSGNYIELYLHFILKDGIEFRILTDIFTYIFFDTYKNAKNIIDYLLVKNTEIVIEKEVIRNKISMK